MLFVKISEAFDIVTFLEILRAHNIQEMQIFVTITFFRAVHNLKSGLDGYVISEMNENILLK